METNELNPEKSLQIISEAVRRSRREFEKNAGTPLIIWGMSILLLSLVVWLVWKSTDNPAWNFLWFSTIILWIVFSIIDKKKEKKVKTKNFLGEIIGYVWISYGIFAIGLSIIFCFISPIYVDAQYSIALAPIESAVLTWIIVILLGFTTLITGFIVNNKWIMISGIINGLGCHFAYYSLNGADLTLLISIASLISMLIPGIILNLQSRKE